jgi:Exopolyphosphatase
VTAVRLGVLDVGSNTVHLLVMDAHRGAQPLPQHSHKTELRLAELVRDGRLGKSGADALAQAVIAARAEADELDCDELLAFATSAVRDADDSARVLKRVEKQAGVALSVLSGADEARLTFLAVRRWFGWSAGHLVCLDIGGGSLELAAGSDEDPALAFSLPLGAARVTREWFSAIRRRRTRSPRSPSTPPRCSKRPPPNCGQPGAPTGSSPPARPSAPSPGWLARRPAGQGRGCGASSPGPGSPRCTRSSPGWRRPISPSWTA